MIHVGNADHRECNAQTKKRVRKLKSGNSVRKLKKKMLDKFCISKYTKQVACRGES